MGWRYVEATSRDAFFMQTHSSTQPSDKSRWVTTHHTCTQLILARVCICMYYNNSSSNSPRCLLVRRVVPRGVRSVCGADGQQRFVSGQCVADLCINYVGRVESSLIVASRWVVCLLLLQFLNPCFVGLSLLQVVVDCHFLLYDWCHW